MVLVVRNNPYAYELEKLTSSFFPEEHVIVVIDGKFKDGSEPVLDGESKSVVVELITTSDDIVTAQVSYFEDDVVISSLNEKLPIFTDGLDNRSISLADSSDSIELHCAQLLYKVLSEVTGLDLGWGLLTGIRPSKLLIRLMDEKGEEEGIEYFKNCFLVSPKKAKLARNVASAEESVIATSKPDSFSLYISIPFCPTRCSYCSFVSSAVNTTSAKKIIEPYFENLCREIEYTGELASKSGIKMLSAYVGGGTPSTLSAAQIERLLKLVNTSFDLSTCGEFTFEAGRPDTITEDKLCAIRDGGIDRISINPQTMNDGVLNAVGRRHSAQDVIDVYNAARRLGFTNINMDLIAGLPTDTLDGFKYSLNKLIEMNPESITVHALAFKRSSDLNYTDGLFSTTRDTASMIDFANDTLYQNGYIPYYMYRQAKSVGNLENVGWCKDGYLSKYNIYMMEECHTILACGAGAVTKLKDPYGPNIERIFNFKYPFEYNDRFDEQILRKNRVLDFYGRSSLPKGD